LIPSLELSRVALILADFRATVLREERERRVPAWLWFTLGVLVGLAAGDLWP
jgi:hypothetical protein